MAKATKEDVDREAARARAATPSARVTAYEVGPYVRDRHISIGTSIGDLASSHSSVYRALKNAGITPARNYPGDIQLTVDDDMRMSDAKAFVVAVLEAAGIKVRTSW